MSAMSDLDIRVQDGNVRPIRDGSEEQRLAYQKMAQHDPQPAPVLDPVRLAQASGLVRAGRSLNGAA